MFGWAVADPTAAQLGAPLLVRLGACCSSGASQLPKPPGCDGKALMLLAFKLRELMPAWLFLWVRYSSFRFCCKLGMSYFITQSLCFKAAACPTNKIIQCLDFITIPTPERRAFGHSAWWWLCKNVRYVHLPLLSLGWIYSLVALYAGSCFWRKPGDWCECLAV